MKETIEQNIKNLSSKDKEMQGQSYRFLMEQTENPVDWAYDVWDNLLYLLKHGNNRSRSIAGQLLCNLAKSDPEERIRDDYQKVLDATRDKRFVTARHILQSLWKIGVVNNKLLETTIEGLNTRFKDCKDEKACRIVRADIIIQFKKIYEQLKDESLKEQAAALIDIESNEKYKKKYLKEWKDLQSAK